MKKSGISRTKNRLAIILLCAFVVSFILGCLIREVALIYIAAACFIADFILMITTNRCLYCGEYFRGLYWSKEAGFCRKCGKQIRFDDEADQE